MKPEMDLVRKILQIVEENGDPFNIRLLKVDGYEKDVVAYHVGILHDGECSS